MNKRVPIAKMSKKAQKEWNSAQRSTWKISPTTRRAPCARQYDRKKLRIDKDPELLRIVV